MFLDLTATRTFGNWELGVVSYYASQVAADADNDHNFAPAPIEVKPEPEIFALGLLVSDHAGRAVKNFNIPAKSTRNTTLGRHFWLDASVGL